MEFRHRGRRAPQFLWENLDFGACSGSVWLDSLLIWALKIVKFKPESSNSSLFRRAMSLKVRGIDSARHCAFRNLVGGPLDGYLLSKSLKSVKIAPRLPPKLVCALKSLKVPHTKV